MIMTTTQANEDICIQIIADISALGFESCLEDNDSSIKHNKVAPDYRMEMT